MSRISQRVFLLLIGVQAAHSVEEYTTRLWEVLAPARFVSGLFSSEPAIGFAIANAALVAFGVWCWLVPIRSGQARGRPFAWIWIAIELANGVSHTGLALLAGSYFPGVATAPLLFGVATWLALRLRREGRAPPRAGEPDAAAS